MWCPLHPFLLHLMCWKKKKKNYSTPQSRLGKTWLPVTPGVTDMTGWAVKLTLSLPSLSCWEQKGGQTSWQPQDTRQILAQHDGFTFHPPHLNRPLLDTSFFGERHRDVKCPQWLSEEMTKRREGQCETERVRELIKSKGGQKKSLSLSLLF